MTVSILNNLCYVAHTLVHNVKHHQMAALDYVLAVLSYSESWVPYDYRNHHQEPPPDVNTER